MQCTVAVLGASVGDTVWSVGVDVGVAVDVVGTVVGVEDRLVGEADGENVVEVGVDVVDVGATERTGSFSSSMYTASSFAVVPAFFL
jgi:hypothetical protein